MQCPRCQTENRAGRRFCAACGASLALACPACGFTNEPDEKFCGGCGMPLTLAARALEPRFQAPQSYTPKHLAEKILTSRAALAGERKQVTVLFCDLPNSTPLAARLGPEAMHTLLNQFFELALGEVRRYEGTINQFLGDGFMALFGAPIAHEDHARRAVLAAVGLQRRLREGPATLGQQYGAELAVRVGLNTGLVVVGAIGDNLRMDYTAIGDTTNVAARLQQAAAPGQIVISEAMHRLVAGYCTTHALGTLALKGKAEPICAWEVVAAQETRTRLEVEAECGLTPFVGRERELRLLHECFAQAEGGHRQVVFLVGAAGIGKSRLLLEFRQQLGTAATWLEGHALSFGRTMALHPMIDLLKRNFRIEAGDTEGTLSEKIERGVLRLGDDLRPILPYLRYLFAVDPGEATVRTMDPQLRRAEIIDALRRLLLRAAEVRPQVVVFEDLHWIDQATEALLTFTADSIPTSRVLYLFTYRPGYAPPFGDRTYHTRMALAPLSNAGTVQMARAMLATEQRPDELVALLVQKAEGNPFFVEEVVKSLQETGAIQQQGDRYVLTRPVDDIVVPDTIQDVLMARIDRLEEAPKRTLQLAAVIGREFPRRLLDRLATLLEQTEASLQALKALELIYEKPRFPELAYVFTHALIQDVAYNSLLVQRRQELHRLIGQAIEELYADRLAEQYEVLAYHFAKGEAWAKAVEYLYQAAEKAAQAFATREAIALYDQALEAAGYLGDVVDTSTLMAIHQAKADLYFFNSGLALTGKGDYDEALARFEEGLILSEKVGNEVYRHRLLNSLGWLSLECGDLDRAIDLNRRGAEGARKRDDPETIANAELNLGDIFLAQGDLTLAHEFLDSVHRLAHNPATSEWMKWRYSTHLFASLGELWLARSEPARAEEFALARRQWDEAEAWLRQALTLAQTVGNPTQLWKTHIALGRLYAEARRSEQAQQAYRAAREVIEQVKAGLQNPGLRTSLEHSPLVRYVYDLSTAG